MCIYMCVMCLFVCVHVFVCVLGNTVVVAIGITIGSGFRPHLKKKLFGEQNEVFILGGQKKRIDQKRKNGWWRDREKRDKRELS